MTRFALAAAGLATVLTLAACGSSSNTTRTSGSTAPAGGSPSSSMSTSVPAAGGSDPGGSTANASGMLVIKNFAYSGHLTVKPGEVVKVVNDDGAPHTVTAKDGKFDSGTVNGSGGTGSFTAPTQPGKYKFGCNFHPNMAGTLTVTG